MFLVILKIGTLPFNYLGVPVFRGKPKVVHLQPIVDKIKAKLSSWKALLLSIAGRVAMVKSIIHSMLTHCITFYSWPVSLLKEIEKWIRNFIWSGDINKRKIVTVAWKKVCKPFAKGGLGIISLITLNQASNLKLRWDLITSQQPWAILLRKRAIRGRKPINYHIFSSIWSSVKSDFQSILNNSQWILGSGDDIRFWTDPWCGPPIADSLNIPPHQATNLSAIVSDFIFDFEWYIPPVVLQSFPHISSLFSHIFIPKVPLEDNLVWSDSKTGNLTLKEAFTHLTPPGQHLQWAKKVWSVDFPPSKSLLSWRLMHDRVPTDDQLMKRGCSMASICSLCFSSCETTFHLFFQCSFARKLWS